MKALVLDDDRSIVTLMKHVLTRRGYEVSAYLDPVACPLYHAVSCAACSFAAEGCPDLILTDVVMPHVNGVEFVERLQHIGCKCPHIAMMSGNWQDQYVEGASRMGVQMFAKPFPIRQFERWLDTWADRDGHFVALPQEALPAAPRATNS